MEHAHHHQMESEGNSVTFTTEALDTDQRSEDLAQHGITTILLLTGILHYLIDVMWFRYGYDEDVFPWRL